MQFGMTGGKLLQVWGEFIGMQAYKPGDLVGGTVVTSLEFLAQTNALLGAELPRRFLAKQLLQQRPLVLPQV